MANPLPTADRDDSSGRGPDTAVASAHFAGTDPFPNGYHFPPRHPFKVAAPQTMRAFWRYIQTPVGLFVLIYGLLVVAWGGMLFLLLCQASPAMCHPNCSDINSARRIWIEIDSQIVNALFCVTGFGLAPWRFRDLYYLLRYRLGSSSSSASRRHDALRHLAAIHRGWFRLPQSQSLPPGLGPATVHLPEYEAEDRLAISLPEKRVSDAPLTGVRASSTPVWKLDLVIWLFVANSVLQVALAVVMWAMNRYVRPGSVVGVLIALGLVAAAVAGLMISFEGSRINKVEGVPLNELDIDLLARDRELGIPHYNNIKDKKPG